MPDIETRIGEVQLNFPVLEVSPDALIIQHAEVGRLTKDQGLALRSLRDAARASNMRLANGRHVETNADVLRALLESVHAQIKPQAFNPKVRI